MADRRVRVPESDMPLKSPLADFPQLAPAFHRLQERTGLSRGSRLIKVAVLLIHLLPI